MGGKEFTFSLADALKKGPVVLYFYPAAFTSGCTVEAHDFADATDKFAALGATVIGVSHDKIEVLDKFSVSDCRSKFAVAADPDGTVIKSYDAVLPIKPEYSNRTSYVISPEGKVLMSYTALNPDKHVENTMAAVQQWHDAHQIERETGLTDGVVTRTRIGDLLFVLQRPFAERAHGIEVGNGRAASAQKRCWIRAAGECCRRAPARAACASACVAKCRRSSRLSSLNRTGPPPSRLNHQHGPFVPNPSQKPSLMARRSPRSHAKVPAWHALSALSSCAC